jgi:hypothetical protein
VRGTASVYSSRNLSTTPFKPLFLQHLEHHSPANALQQLPLATLQACTTVSTQAGRSWYTVRTQAGRSWYPHISLDATRLPALVIYSYFCKREGFLSTVEAGQSSYYYTIVAKVTFAGSREGMVRQHSTLHTGLTLLVGAGAVGRRLAGTQHEAGQQC